MARGGRDGAASSHRSAQVLSTTCAPCPSAAPRASCPPSAAAAAEDIRRGAAQAEPAPLPPAEAHAAPGTLAAALAAYVRPVALTEKTLFVITPTYTRLTQLLELTRLVTALQVRACLRESNTIARAVDW